MFAPKKWLSGKGTVILLVVLYFGGLVGILFDFPTILSQLANRVLGGLPAPVAGILMGPIWGLCFILPAIAGPMAFAVAEGKFQKHRLTASCVILGLLFFAGHQSGFGRNQWLWLDLYMCGQLIILGFTLPATQPTNYLAFALLAIAYLSHLRRPLWTILDYIWGGYFIILAVVIAGTWPPRATPNP